ncbi:MAG: efflux transporter outer membrane subunit [Planctomycetota bacterium]
MDHSRRPFYHGSEPRSVLCIAGMLFACAAFIAGATGCKVGPDYEGPPEIEMPEAFGAVEDPAFVPGTTDLRTWWEIFDDPMLNEVIEAAASDNLDLRIAMSRVIEARARVDIAESARSPLIALGGGSAVDSNAATGFDPRVQSSLSLQASWELDVFGRVARQIEAAEATSGAAEEDRRDVQVSTFAETANRYLSVRSLQSQLETAEQNIESQREILELTEIRRRDGLASRLDVVRAEQLLASSEAILPPLRIQLNRDINTIALLIGTHPQALPFDLQTPAPLPVPPPEVVLGVPAELLRQRPDIRAAERRLAAQTARVGIATTALYPQFSLGGSIGSSFSSTPLSFSLGPSVRWTLFDGGAVRSQISVEDAVLEQALLAYEQTVLRAIEEVETSMTTFIEQRIRLDAVNRSADSAREAFRLARGVYREGLIDFQDLLSVQMELLSAESQVAEASGLASQNLVSLYKALGGGWDPEQPADRATNE